MYASTIAATIGQLTARIPIAIGVINNDNFSTDTIGDYSTSFVTGSASVSGGDLLLAGGNALWSNDYVAFNKTGSPYTRTCLNSWTQTITFKNTTTSSGTSYGFGIGIISTNTQTPASIWLWLRLDNDAQGGKVYINSRQGTTNNFINNPTAGTALRKLLNDEFSITVTVSDNTISWTAINITNSNQTVTGSYSFTFVSSEKSLNNTGQFAVCLLGGTQEVHDWNTSSTALIKNTRTAFVGDSITWGAYAQASIARWPLKAMGSSSPYTINSGVADYTQSVVDRLPELIALNPSYVVLMIGGNDILYGISSGTWQANYSTIVSSLKAVGIQVVHCYPTPRNATDITALNTYLAANFPGDTKVDTYTPLWSGVGTGLNAAYDSGDGTHINADGHQVIGNTVLAAAPFIR